MLQIKVTGLQQFNKDVQREVDRFIDRVSDDIVNVARSYTPIRLGKARNGWKKKRYSNYALVENRVIYIDKLEQGSSKQAPTGITGPTLREILRRKY